MGFGIAVGVGSTVGAGILRTPGLVAGQLRSVPLILLAWSLGALYALACSISVSELGAMLPAEGGWYVHARRAFGEFGGYFAGYADWLVMSVALSYLATVAGEVSAGLFPPLAGHLKLAACFVLISFGLLHLMGIRVGSRAQQLNSFLVGVALFAFAAVCFLWGRSSAPEAAVPALAPRATGFPLLLGFIVAFQSVLITYDGWCGPIYFQEEDRDPVRNLPRSILGGALCSIAIFLLINLALLYVLPLSNLAASKAPAADAAQVIFGDAGGRIVLLISLLTILGCTNATLLVAPRILFALGRDGLFLRRAAEVNQGGTPANGLLLTVLLAGTLVLSGSFEKLIAIQSILLVVLYLTGWVSFFVLRKREPDLPRPFRAWLYPWTPLAALLGSLVYLVLNFASDVRNGLIAFALIGCSFPAYRVLISRRRQASGSLHREKS